MSPAHATVSLLGGGNQASQPRVSMTWPIEAGRILALGHGLYLQPSSKPRLNTDD